MKDKSVRIISFVVIIFLILSFVIILFNVVKNQTEKAQEILERCKEKGWDGVKFKQGLSTELICANITQAERDTNEVIGE